MPRGAQGPMWQNRAKPNLHSIESAAHDAANLASEAANAGRPMTATTATPKTPAPGKPRTLGEIAEKAMRGGIRKLVKKI